MGQVLFQKYHTSYQQQQHYNLQYESNKQELDESEELMAELRLALEQSEILLRKIAMIEVEYKKAIKTDAVLPSDVIELAEQLGFVVPIHLTKSFDFGDEIQINSTPKKEVTEETEIDEMEDYKFVNFDELEKYLVGPLVASETEPSNDQYQELTNEHDVVEEVSSPSFFKDTRIDAQKQDLGASLITFASPASSTTGTSPVVTNQPEFPLTDEQQQLIEEQDVNHLLEQLQLYTEALSNESPSTSQLHISTPIQKAQPQLVKNETKKEESRSLPKIVIDSADENVDLKMQVSQLTKNVELLEEKLSKAEQENEDLRRNLEEIEHEKECMDSAIEDIRDKE